MKKLKLDTDTIVVQSFATDADAESTGTVQAHRFPETTAGPWFCDVACAMEE